MMRMWVFYTKNELREVMEDLQTKQEKRNKVKKKIKIQT